MNMNGAWENQRSGNNAGKLHEEGVLDKGPVAGDWQAEDVGQVFLSRDPEGAGSMPSVGWA